MEVVLELHTREICLKDKKKFVVHPLSDVHIGAEKHKKQLLKEKIKQIIAGGPTHRVLLLGDLGDTAIVGSPSFRHGATTIQDELTEMVRVFKPIADRVDLIIPGNHERRVNRAVGLDYTQQFATLLGRAESYRPGATVVKYMFGKRKNRGSTPVEMFCHHGYGGGRKGGAKFNKVLDLANIKGDCDIYMMGHVHDQTIGKAKIYIGWPPRELERYFVITGCYLGLEPYALDCAYPPSAEGSPVIQVECNSSGQKKIQLLLG